MAGLFSSPGKQAQQAGSITGGQINNEIQNLEGYVSGQEKQLREAISGMPLSPANDVAFGNMGPGLVSGTSSLTPGAAAPPLPGVPGGSAYQPPPQTRGYGGGGGRSPNPFQSGGQKPPPPYIGGPQGGRPQ